MGTRYGGNPCQSGLPGHLLQIFVQRRLLDRVAYASLPCGTPDIDREPLSRWLGQDSDTSWGQARIIAHPELFVREHCVRMDIASADPLFHRNRPSFQKELQQYLSPYFQDAESRRKAVRALYGGRLPSWWVD